MSNIGQFQTKLASFTAETKWKDFKADHHIKGKDLAAALEGFSKEYARLPSMTERERAVFFAERLPRIIDSIEQRRDEVAGKGAVARMLASVTGSGVSKKEEEIGALSEALGRLTKALISIDPSNWSRDSLPEGATTTLDASFKVPATVHELKDVEGQAKRDISGRGHYYLHTPSGDWSKIDNSLAARSKDEVFASVKEQFMALGASEDAFLKAVTAASQDTLNQMSLHLAESGQFLRVTSSAAYFHCESDGSIKVLIEARGELKASHEIGASSQDVILRSIYNPAESADSVRTALYS